MELVLTVGSTRFDALVIAILSRVHELPFETMFLQIGAFPVDQLPRGLALGLQTIGKQRIHIVKYTDDIEERVARARVVVSHAGAGTVLSFLRPVVEPEHRQRTLVLVPNHSLMDSHQADLAVEMAKGDYATVSTVERVVDDIVRLEKMNDKATATTKVPPKADIGPILDAMLAV